MLTKRQNFLYWTEWNAARKAVLAAGQPEPDRHTLHISALGYDKSHLTLTNGEFDKILSAFRALSRPSDLDSQVSLASMPRTRVLYGLRNHPLGLPYVLAVAKDKFGTSDLDALTDPQLEQLRNTMANRTLARNRRAREVGPALRSGPPSASDEPF